MAISHPTGSEVADLMRECTERACPGLAYMTPDGFGFDDGCAFTCPLDRASSLVEMLSFMKSVHEAHHAEAPHTFGYRA